MRCSPSFAVFLVLLALAGTAAAKPLKYPDPVKVHRRPGVKSDLAVSVDGPTIGGAAGCGWAVPLALKPDQDEAKVRLTVAGKRKPGRYGIVVSRAWAADLRAGRPGPCTPIILLHVLPPKASVKGP